MKQADLDRAVAAATGESVSTIKRLGFLLAEEDTILDHDPETIDWDELQLQRQQHSGRPTYEPAAA